MYVYKIFINKYVKLNLNLNLIKKMDSKFNLNFSLCPTSINFDERINTDYSQSSFNDIEMTDHMDNIIIDENNNKLLSHCFCGNNEDSLKMM